MRIIKNLLVVSLFGVFLLHGYKTINDNNTINETFLNLINDIAITDACNECKISLFKTLSVIENENDSLFYKYYEESNWYYQAITMDFDVKYSHLHEQKTNFISSFTELNDFVNSTQIKDINRDEIFKIALKVEKSIIEIESKISYNNAKEGYLKNKSKLRTIQLLVIGLFITIGIVIMINIKK